MRRHIGRMGLKTWMASALLVWLVTLVTVSARSPGEPRIGEKSAPAPNPSQSAAPAPAPAVAPAATQKPTGPAKYVGDKSCLGCHEEQAGYERSPHHWAADPRTPAAKQGCETCHGPGSLHVGRSRSRQGASTTSR